jgi:hypothetical protein
MSYLASNFYGGRFKFKLLWPVICSGMLCAHSPPPTSLELVRPRLDCIQHSLLFLPPSTGPNMSLTALVKSDHIDRPGVCIPLGVPSIVISIWVHPGCSTSSSSSPHVCSFVGGDITRPLSRVCTILLLRLPLPNSLYLCTWMYLCYTSVSLVLHYRHQDLHACGCYLLRPEELFRLLQFLSFWPSHVVSHGLHLLMCPTQIPLETFARALHPSLRQCC